MLILNHFYRMKIEDSKSINKPNDSVSIDEEEKEKESQQQSISKEKEEKIKADFIKRLQNKFSKILITYQYCLFISLWCIFIQ